MLVLYCLLCTLDDRIAKSNEEEEQSTACEALDEKMNLCLYEFSHFRRLPLLLNTPFSSPPLPYAAGETDTVMST